MKFALFDHVDRSDRPMARQLDERLEYVAAADAAGFYAYHVAEHHATPLNLVPVPGVYLGAVARATKRMRLGPLVYLLPLYSPLRLLEEIGILDHLCHGRLDVGVGRGVSPFELNYHKVDPETSREVFVDALDCMLAGLTQDRLTYRGKHFSYDNVPMEVKPLQQPHPPIWYPSSNEAGAQWAGERGLHFSTLGSVERAALCVAAFKRGLAKRGRAAVPKPEIPGGTVIGVNRQAVLADTVEDARRIAKPAFAAWYASLTKLERDNVGGPRYVQHVTGDLEAALKSGQVIVGTPETFAAEVARQQAAIGVNYMNFSFFFGTMPFADAMRSIKLFAGEVMPKLAALYPDGVIPGPAALQAAGARNDSHNV
jgi:alkanesulfonate monooxygenase SsuD/methylene tetrahydromethanopterin reductase-like flavin-dependent oxidoreductase (luciferase family)